MQIEKRIKLRNISRSDLHYFYTWASDPEVAKSMTWEAHTCLEESNNFLIDVAEKHPWFKAICLDGVPVGSITLTPGRGLSSCKAELGYVLARDHWGKGIATIAVMNALKNGFSDLGIQRIEAFVDPENIASQKVLIKAGMVNEALLKKQILFKGSVKDRILYASFVD